MTGDRADTAALQWWRATLEEAPAALELPRGDGGRTAHLSWSDDTGAAIDRQNADGVGWSAADERLVTAMAGLLGRYSSGGAVVLTVGIAGEWWPLRADLADNPTRATAERRCRDAFVAALEHRAPLASIVAEAGGCAAQAALSLDGTAWPLGDAPAVFVSRSDTGLDVAGAADVQTSSAHLDALLSKWHADSPLAAVEILTAHERADLLATSAGPTLDLPDGTVWDRIAEQIRAAPDAVALVDDGQRLTYAEMDARIASVATALAERGIGPGDLVGLCVQRSARMVVGLLAIMRSGAAYVPIDPTYPAGRVAMMIEDAKLTTVVTERALLPQIPDEIADRILVDHDPGAGDGGDAGDGRRATPPAVTAGDLAYVIFTSGSTGRPKGVMIEHQALLNFVLAIAREPGMRRDDRLLAVTTLSFDIAGLELLAPLVVGATVVVADRDTVVDPAALASRLDHHDITIMQATPATWRMLVDWGWMGRPDLRILCGGEALPAILADELRERCSELWNMYGPTETTIWSLATRIAAGDPVTIGRPIDNTTTYVAGRHQELLPDGIPGELLIGGSGLARGYLHRSDLTSERFVPDAITGRAGERLYRTGDLVRRRADGRIEFISRMDNQVKVRGFRIELGEIESILDARPDVGRTVAVVIADADSGMNQLVAYAVPAPGAQLDPRTLRDHVGAHLPPHMVPSSVMVLDEFPLTLNGKIDRKALPAVELAAPSDRAVVSPRTEVERTILGIWKDVLRVDPLGVTDDVFELGAGSLTIARLYTRIAQELHVDLPVAAAFHAATVERIAAVVEQARDGRRSTGAYKSLVPIRATGQRLPLFLVHGGAGTVLLFEPLARGLGDEQPVYALQAAGLYGKTPPQRSVADMADLYIAEMRSVQAAGPYRIGGYCYGALVAFEMARRLAEIGERTELLIAFNGSSPSYIRQYRPLFDADGARTDASGQLIVQPDSTAQRFGARWRNRESMTTFAAQTARALAGRARGVAQHRTYLATLHGAVLLKRPLPESRRESGAFQYLSVYAQRRYDPPRYDGDIVVVRAAGLYHRDDLGWSDYVNGTVDVVEVEGAQRTPRDSMKTAYVSPIVTAIRGRLDALENADSAPSVTP